MGPAFARKREQPRRNVSDGHGPHPPFSLLRDAQYSRDGLLRQLGSLSEGVLECGGRPLRMDVKHE